MKKRISLYIAVANELKLFLPLISKGLQLQNVQLSLIVQKGSKKSTKSRFYEPNLNPFHDLIQIEYLNHEPDLYKSINKLNSDAIILSSVPKRPLVNIKLNTKTELYYLQHSTDIISNWPYIFDSDFFDLFDGFFVFSSYWKIQFLRLLETKVNFTNNELECISSKIFEVGLPELDQVKSLNENSIRLKYDLDLNKKIVFFDTLPVVRHVPNFFYKYYFSINGSWYSMIQQILESIYFDIRQYKLAFLKFPYYGIKLLFSKKLPNYKSIFLNLREYCDRNNLLLVSKSREKNNDPDWVKKNCDLFLVDTEFYPFTLLELMHVSDYYVGFNSTSVLEAAYCRLPSALFQAFPTEYQYAGYGGDVFNYLNNSMKTHKEWLNYPRVSEPRYFQDDADNYFLKLTDQQLSETDHHNYVKKFLGFLDGESSKRVFDIINHEKTSERN